MMNARGRPVTVSIVMHRHAHLLRPLLRALGTWSAPCIERVIVTLNVPEQLDLDLDADLGFEVEWIRNTRPRGFGANHNSAFARSASPWFLVLNPDIAIDCDALGALLARARPGAGVLAPRVREPGQDEPQPFRGLVTPAELIRRRRRDHHPPSSPSWIGGMFMLLNADAYRQIRGFDERFFMYCEDVDLCVRLQLAGWSLQVADDVAVTHAARRASHSSPQALAWHVASLVKLWTSQAFWRYLRLQRS